MTTRRGFLGMLTALPFVPKIVEAATTVRDVARFAHDGVSVDRSDPYCSACPYPDHCGDGCFNGYTIHLSENEMAADRVVVVVNDR